MPGDGENRVGMAEDRLTAAALAWFSHMRSDEKTPQDERQFQAWLDADPKHAAAYDAIQATWEALSGMADAPKMQAMRQQALQRRSRTVFAGAMRMGRGRPRQRALRALAASVVLTIAGALALISSGIGQALPAYRTAAGERTTVAMDDGTLVTLSPESRLLADFTPGERRVKLKKGEAYFDVAHDAGRPFVVEAGSGEITALGTEFDVYKKNGETVVTLIQGRVEVAAHGVQRADGPVRTRLAPGERVSYDRNGLSEVRTIDLARAVAWRDGRIFVENEPLEKVVAEINRHSKRKIRLGRSDPELRRIVVSGVFRTDRPEALVEFLKDAGIPIWEVKDSQGNITLYLRPDSKRG